MENFLDSLMFALLFIILGMLIFLAISQPITFMISMFFWFLWIVSLKILSDFGL